MLCCCAVLCCGAVVLWCCGVLSSQPDASTQLGAHHGTWIRSIVAREVQTALGVSARVSATEAVTETAPVAATRCSGVLVTSHVSHLDGRLYVSNAALALPRDPQVRSRASINGDEAEAEAAAEAPAEAEAAAAASTGAPTSLPFVASPHHSAWGVGCVTSFPPRMHSIVQQGVPAFFSHPLQRLRPELVVAATAPATPPAPESKEEAAALLLQRQQAAETLLHTRHPHPPQFSRRLQRQRAAAAAAARSITHLGSTAFSVRQHTWCYGSRARAGYETCVRQAVHASHTKLATSIVDSVRRWLAQHRLTADSATEADVPLDADRMWAAWNALGLMELAHQHGVNARYVSEACVVHCTRMCGCAGTRGGAWHCHPMSMVWTCCRWRHSSSPSALLPPLHLLALTRV